ncbi:MAG: hypothetical protein A3A29_01310 [Candidatus Ryanbacteria bacterium RIFCSPLOWO2_01_FULL_47_79]|nr:MAG: hypothetical protein A3A29_01310 [Candidatus Ryanbacteria bacterium RIFCSPLOWO2_01_FULL_47_79]
MTIYFVRHGQTNYNIEGLCNDDPTKDVHLTEEGKKQAEEVAKKLYDRKFEMVYVSELPRTRQTAEIINAFHNAPIEVDGRINDRKTGYDSKPVGDFLKYIGTNIYHAKPEGGESFQEEKQRVFVFLDDLKKEALRSSARCNS